MRDCVMPGIFLKRGLHNHLRRLIDSQIYYFDPCVSENISHDLTAGSVSVEAYVKEAITYRMDAMEMAGRAVPAPVTFIDWAASIGGVNYAAGTPLGAEVFRDIGQEVAERVARKEGALPKEQVRVYWEGHMCRPYMRWWGKTLAELGVNIIAAKYTHGHFFHRPDLIDPASRPSEGGPFMEKSRASRTAQSMAMFRALESARQEGVRLFSDPFAICFLSRPMRLAVRAAEKSSVVQACLAKFIDQRWPGARPSGVARTALIDSVLRKELASGIEQVAILGAGYDSRAYRIEEMKRVRVFELDRGETQRLKRKRLARVLGRLPQHVILVQMDFLRQTLPEALVSSGFDPGRKTFFIWEGVTHYLDADAVDSTMRFVASCAAGSVIAFTYIHRGLLDGSGTFSLSPNVVRLLEGAGEHWTFGFYPEELPAYLRARGLHLIEDLGAVEYGALRMGATKEQMKGYEFYHVAVATVGTPGGGDCQE